MDRNFRPLLRLAPLNVALRKESVDRNVLALLYDLNIDASLSARRAWIEMSEMLANGRDLPVALRKESVDRNNLKENSSSAWLVALRKESMECFYF